MGVVEVIDPLDMALQILDLLLDLNDGNVKSAMVDSLFFESRLHGQHLLLELLDTLVLLGKLLPLRPVLVRQAVDHTVEMLGLGVLGRDVVGHLGELLLQGHKPVTIALLVVGKGVVILIAILRDNLISCSQVRVTLTTKLSQSLPLPGCLTSQ